MSKQLVKIISKGEYTVIYDGKGFNPFKVNYIHYDLDGTKHRERLAVFADYGSCLYYLADIVEKDFIPDRG